MNKNTLSYVPSLNRFVDTNWCIIHDLRKFFDNWQLDQWKTTKGQGLVTAKNGEVWEISCLSPDEEEETFECIAWNESFGVHMDRLYY